MIGSLACLLLQSALSAGFNPNANALFDRDSVLKAWAISQFDTNRDGWLTLYEAQPAIAAFRLIADGDSNGHITVVEFRRAKEFIAARY
jgi:hypothetical protein